MPLTDLIPKSFGGRLVAMVLAAGSVPVIIFSILLSVFSNHFIIETRRAIDHSQKEQWQRSEAILVQMAEGFIREKAFDIATQLDLFLESHPDLTVNQLQHNDQFRRLAVQVIGREGYSAVQDADRGYALFHPDPAVVNSDLRRYRDRAPEFWQIIEASLGGKFAEGSYAWDDPNGVRRQKYMYIVPLENSTAEGVRLAVAATAYQNDFHRPIQTATAFSESASHLLRMTVAETFHKMRLNGFLFMTLSVVFVFVLACWSGYYCSRAIHLLRGATRQVNLGNFEVDLKGKMSGDIGQLIADFSAMTRNLAETTVKKEQLEEVVRARTEELQKANSSLRLENEERSKAEEKLRRSEARMAAILRASPVGIGHVKDRRLDWANEMMYQLIGYEPDSLLGEDARILYASEEEYHRVGEIMAEVINTGQAGMVRTRWQRRDGSTFDCSLRAYPLTPSDPSDGLIVVATDVSESLQMEEKLQRAQKMEAIGTLAGGVAHDLNNILTGLMSYPEFLLLDLPDDSPLRKPLEAIRKSGEDAAAIVQDLLTMARRGVAITESLDLNVIIRNQLKSPELQSTLRHHPDTHLDVRLGEDLSRVRGSGPHLAKTIMNLINNGAEAMAGGGTITITTKMCHLDRDYQGYEKIPAGDYVTVAVGDEGTGIAKNEIARIFEPFYTKKKMGRSGSGLGMAVVWGTVKDHQGYLDVASHIGQGTTFTLFFRCDTTAEDPADSGFSLSQFTGRGESLLVVDDNDAQREIAAAILQRLNYRVTTLGSGEEAVVYLQEHDIDLLLLDMIMEPGIDGLETYRQIRSFKPDIRLIIISGFSETARINDLQRISDGSYLKKPYTIEQIGRTVQKALRRQS